MKLQDFIIGLMAFILVSIVILLLTFDFYDEDSLNIDLDNDTYTQSLSDLQTTVNEARGNITNTNSYMRSKSPGQEGVDLESPNIAEGDLIQASLSALTNVPTYYKIFISMITTMFNMVGGVVYEFFWFFTGAIVVIITLLLVSSVLRNRL